MKIKYFAFLGFICLMSFYACKDDNERRQKEVQYKSNDSSKSEGDLERIWSLMVDKNSRTVFQVTNIKRFVNEGEADQQENMSSGEPHTYQIFFIVKEQKGHYRFEYFIQYRDGDLTKNKLYRPAALQKGDVELDNGQVFFVFKEALGHLIPEAEQRLMEDNKYLIKDIEIKTDANGKKRKRFLYRFLNKNKTGKRHTAYYLLESREFSELENYALED